MMELIDLTNAPIKKVLKIKKIESGEQFKRQLINMGFQLNDLIEKLSNSTWGPILLRNVSTNSQKMALGRGLAEKIIVSIDDQNEE